MLKRVVSGIVGIPLLIGIILYGGPLIYISVMAISLIGIYEFYLAVENKGINPVRWIGYVLTIAILSQFYFDINISQFTLFSLVIAIILISIILLLKPQYNILDASATLYGIFYVSILLGHIILISNHENSIAIWLVFITAWGTDTFAYFTGVFFGKKKLCPSISPKKTVVGAIGGISGSMLISGLFAYFFLNNNVFLVMMIGFIGSILSQTGDLTASVIKRYVGIKDFGALIPGHGGVLDRFDSILFTAPVIYYFILYIL
ncbi:phosphatidate cytidylyltransferase [Alkaliphilus peptidifermentans]|uniref:Phosphatidate cytidylyltransferase n=1 Tax=Alkaliphilus peptidifermentans DSM 18978 TaxID=1120976 RepID=A0A1G5DDK4_9FIRM|nr:phosphatidate cytidylyltransferase [Alkaliphilus peptidifermentans]SCY12843.1 phosphatidate cytidylyltransferase [Alkaliphilus peptidifermentans DSM 18978]